MGFFNRPDKRAAAQPHLRSWERHPATIDVTLGDPGLAAYRAAVERDDWRAARDCLRSIAPDRAARAVVLVDDAASHQAMFDAWVGAHPDEAEGLLARAALRQMLAWDIRGSGYAETVDPGAWDGFHQALRDGTEDAYRAVDLDPGSALPYPILIQSSLGLSAPQEEIIGLFDRAHERVPYFPAACRVTLQALAPKWGGSEESMFGLARMARESCPPGHSQHALVAQAHIEMELANLRDSKDPAQLMRTDVRREILEAAEASVFAPEFVADADGLEALNIFAYCFFLGEDDVNARRCLDALAGRYFDYPWHYLGDAGMRVARCCAVTGWVGPGTPPA